MKISDIIRIAAGNLRRNKLRTVLTVSGVVVGVGAIVFLVSLGFGLQKLALEKIVQLEALKVITVTPGSKSDAILTDDTIGKFQKINGVTIVSPIIRHIATLNLNGIDVEQVLYGVRSEHLDLENLKLVDGKFFDGKDKTEAIISQDIITNFGLKKESLFNKDVTYIHEGPEGKKKGTMKVVGTFEEKGIYVPFDAISQKNESYATIRVKVNDKSRVAEAKRTIESYGYNTSVIQDQSAAVNQVFAIVNIVLGGFGMIAFFVAAIGIFNTMTISLLERTHEIGVMKAIGGNNKDIALIFITESALIGFLGGFFGLITGWLGGVLINLLVNFMATQSGGQAVGLFSIPAIFGVMTVFFSFFISTVAGIWPARRAAKLNPLEALRYE